MRGLLRPQRLCRAVPVGDRPPGLRVTLESRLASLPGSIHLHLRPSAESTGTLEYTLDPHSGRAWLSWHDNRHRPWVDEAVRRLVEDWRENPSAGTTG